MDIDTENYTEEDYIKEFLTTDLLEKLVKWTNSRAAIQAALDSFEDKELEWTNVDVETMRRFIGLTLLMPMIKKSHIRDYWMTDPMLETPYFRSCMSRNRYMAILRFLCFSDPYDVDPEKKNTRLTGMVPFLRVHYCLYTHFLKLIF